MKAASIILPAVALIFIGIQFIPVRLPKNRTDDEKSIAGSGLVSDPVLGILKKSCFDCHSNYVNFPWYAKVAPSSWLLSSHIKEGKEHLNFSEWADYSKRKKLSELEHIGREVKSGGMPLKSYLLIHRGAKLSQDNITALLKWTEDASDRLIDQ